MSKVKNEATIKNPIVKAVREQLEHRALWLYLLCDEAGKRGLSWEDFGSAAVKRCGLYQGAGLVKKGGTQSLKGLRKTLLPNRRSGCLKWTSRNARTTCWRLIFTIARW